MFSKLQSAAKPGARPCSPRCRAPLQLASRPDREACLPTPARLVYASDSPLCFPAPPCIARHGVFPHQAHHGARTRTPHSRTEPAKILSVPPDNKPTLAHSALLSWLRCHLPRHSGGLGARDFWFAGSRFLSFPSLQIWGKFPNLIIGYSYILLFPSSTQPTPVFLDTTSGLRFTFERGLGPGYLPLLPIPARGRLGGAPAFPPLLIIHYLNSGLRPSCDSVIIYPHSHEESRMTSATI